ncbi:MAG TPA: ribosome recycling factor [Candidatus Sulfotelmatobacter sp.]|nr:ribosome recycling factor [Candidatus Sulfotelmatobacter sp.]
MDLSGLTNDTKTKLSIAFDKFSDSLKGLRTGRANASILDGVMVEAYGTNMPLKQVGNVIVPEAQLIQITPFDPSNLEAISTAIRNDTNLGLNPSDDGRVVRIPIPPLTEERRKDLAKQVGAKQEECMISLRNIRHEALDTVDKAKKDKQIGEDEASRLSSQVEDLMNEFRTKIESASKEKEQEILTL